LASAGFERNICKSLKYLIRNSVFILNASVS
jgi:hypothetical protein